jgi:hypothetical protein
MPILSPFRGGISLPILSPFLPILSPFRAIFADSVPL